MSSIRRDDDVNEQIDDASFIIEEVESTPTEDLQGVSGATYSIFMRGADLQFIIDEKVVHTAPMRTMPKFDYKDTSAWAEIATVFRASGYKKAMRAFK